MSSNEGVAPEVDQIRNFRVNPSFSIQYKIIELGKFRSEDPADGGQKVDGARVLDLRTNQVHVMKLENILKSRVISE